MLDVNGADGGHIGAVANAVITERKIEVVNDNVSESRAQGVRYGNPVHEELLRQINSKPNFYGNPNSELDAGDFLNVGYSTPQCTTFNYR